MHTNDFFMAEVIIRENQMIKLNDFKAFLIC